MMQRTWFDSWPTAGCRINEIWRSELIDLDAKRALTAVEPFGLELVSDTHVDAVDQNAAAISAIQPEIAGA